MKLTTSVIVTAIMSALQMLVQLMDIVPPETKPWCLAVQIALEAVKSFLTHAYNPDGTPARVAWDPELKVPPPQL